MPVGFNSPARNLFLLGSSGQQVVTNFFEAIDKSAGTDGVYIPDEIRYIASSQKYALAGTAADSNSKSFGWFERQEYDLETGSLTTDYSNKIVSTQSGVNTILRAMELDSNENLIVVGKTGTVPWIAKYTNGGAITWSSTTNSADVEYFGVASDSNGKYYACGRTSLTAADTQAFVESFDQNGNPGWGKQAFMLGREVTTIAIDANNQGHVVAVGYLEDDTRDKGYIIKIDTDIGEVMWDRTLSSDLDIQCTDVFIDSKDQIYVIANDDTNGYLVKYTAEGNMIWQKKTNQSAGTLSHLQVQSDGETEQTIVFGNYEYNGDQSGVLSKYAKDGRLVFRRTMVSSNNNSDTFDNICLDADASFYYFMYTDQTESGFAGTPDAYTFGKVSSSGNGLGAFQYEDGTGTTIDYEILNAGDTIGRLTDGSVRNDTSDLITYPFGANKLVFDDLATHVSNKRRQMDGPDSFEYSGSPAIRPADFQELNLLGENVELGDQLVLNSNMGYDGRAWTQIDATVNWNLVNATGSNLYYPQEGSNGRALKITNNTNASGYAWQKIPATIGRQHTIRVNVGDNFRLQVGTSHGLGDYVDEALDYTGNSSTLDSFAFTPTTSDTFISLRVDNTASGNYTIAARTLCSINSWKDTSGNNNNGVALGPTHSTSGKYWAFDGVNETIDLGTTPLIASNSDFTVEGWCWVDALTNECSIFEVTSDTTSAVILLSAGSTTDGTVGGRFVVRKDSGSELGMRNPPGLGHSTGEWHHYVGTHINSSNNLFQTKLYVDGVNVQSADTFAGNHDFTFSGVNTQKLGVSSGNRFLDGRIGEFRIYQRALTAAQVFQNYNATKFKYINEVPDIAPKIGPGIVYGSNLLLNYDFANRATYERVENRFTSSDNLLNYSDTSSFGRLTDWSWLGSGTPEAIPNAAIAPDGSLTAWKISGPSLYQSIINDGNFTMSAWVKTVDGSSASVEQSVYLLNTGGTLLYTTHTVTGEWQRITFSSVATSEYGSPAGEYHRYYPCSSAADLYVWGLQVELQSSAGRHVPTYGTAFTTLPTTVKNLSNSTANANIVGDVYHNNGGYFEFQNPNTVGTFTNPTSYMEVPSFDGLQGTSFTVSFWFKTYVSESDSREEPIITYTSEASNNNTTTNEYFSIAVGRDRDQTGNDEAVIRAGGNGGWGGLFGNGGNLTSDLNLTGDGYPFEHGKIKSNTWHRVDYVYNHTGNGSNGTHALYIDGAAAGSANVKTGFNDAQYSLTNGGRLRIGANFGVGKTSMYGGDEPEETASGANNYGYIGEIQIYSEVLTSTEISKNYNATRTKYGV